MVLGIIVIARNNNFQKLLVKIAKNVNIYNKTKHTPVS